MLESLTGCSFPQAPDLCTRYATQISCRREAEECVDISIIPRQDEDAATEQRLRAFKRSMPRLSNETLAQIIQEANSAMGIRMTTDNTDPGLQTFSNDTLKIEICGLEQEHFSVIDVPGIFRYPDHHSPQRTTCSLCAAWSTRIFRILALLFSPYYLLMSISPPKRYLRWQRRPTQARTNDGCPHEA